MIVGYKQILDAVKLIVEAHPGLRGFNVGRNYEVMESSRNTLRFPLLQVQPLSATFNRMTDKKAFPTVDVSLLFRCLDVVDKEEINKTQVYNDTLQYLQNIVDTMCHHEWFRTNNIEISSNFIVCIPEEYTTTSRTCGWTSTISIKIMNWNGICGLPLNYTAEMFNVYNPPKLPDIGPDGDPTPIK